MSLKLSGSLPSQTVTTRVIEHKNTHEGIEGTDYRESYGNGKAHVKEYPDGEQEVYVNW